MQAMAVFSQSVETWTKWDVGVIDKANTARDVYYLTSDEKKVILLTNLARTNGPLFAETFLKEFMKNKNSSRYSRSLERDLKDIRNLPLLYPRKDLFEKSKEHAQVSGKNGTTGHQNIGERVRPLLENYSIIAENCAYGFEKAFNNVIALLIDEGISDLGHRKNMLNEEFNSIGVSIQPHKRYDFNCVMTFGSILN